MTMPLVFRPAAEDEFDAAALWYDGQRAGLGLAFVSEIQRILDKIAEQPDRYPAVFGDIREAPVPRFPYAIYYRTKPRSVVIIAVFHCSRNPAVWQRRQ